MLTKNGNTLNLLEGSETLKRGRERRILHEGIQKCRVKDERVTIKVGVN